MEVMTWTAAFHKFGPEAKPYVPSHGAASLSNHKFYEDGTCLFYGMSGRAQPVEERWYHAIPYPNPHVLSQKRFLLHPTRYDDPVFLDRAMLRADILGVRPFALKHIENKRAFLEVYKKVGKILLPPVPEDALNVATVEVLKVGDGGRAFRFGAATRHAYDNQKFSWLEMLGDAEGFEWARKLWDNEKAYVARGDYVAFIRALRDNAIIRKLKKEARTQHVCFSLPLTKVYFFREKGVWKRLLEDRGSNWEVIS